MPKQTQNESVERFVQYVEADCEGDEPRAQQLAQEMVDEDGLDSAFLEVRDRPKP